jgi:hypothetical protein
MFPWLEETKFLCEKFPPGSLLLPVTSHVDFSRSTYTKTTPTLPLWGLYRQWEICQKKGRKEKLCRRCDIPRIFSFTPKYPKVETTFWDGKIIMMLSLSRPAALHCDAAWVQIERKTCSKRRIYFFFQITPQNGREVLVQERKEDPRSFPRRLLSVPWRELVD